MALWDDIVKTLGETGAIPSLYKKGLERERKRLAEAKGLGKVKPYARVFIRELSPLALAAEAPSLLRQQFIEPIAPQRPIETKREYFKRVTRPTPVEELVTEPIKRMVKRPIGLIAPKVYPTVEEFKKDPAMEIIDMLWGAGILTKAGRARAIIQAQKELGITPKALRVAKKKQLPLPGIKTQLAKAKVKKVLVAEAAGIKPIPKKPAEIPELPFQAVEQQHLPLEGLRPIEQKIIPEAMAKTIKEGVPLEKIAETGVVPIIRPTRKIFGRERTLYHSIYEPYTYSEKARYPWLTEKRTDLANIWKGTSVSERTKIDLAGIQGDNLANGLPINYAVNSKLLKKFGLGKEQAINLTSKEQTKLNQLNDMFAKHQAEYPERLAKRAGYWPAVRSSDIIDKAFRKMYPEGQLPPDIVSFAERIRKGSPLARGQDARITLDRYFNSEANAIFYGDLMQPTRQIVSQLRKGGKNRWADYTENYAERMIGIPGKLDRQIMSNAMAVQEMMGKPLNPEVAVRASQTLIDLQYSGGIGIKPSTAIRNLAQLINDAGEIGAGYTGKGIYAFLKNPRAALREAQQAGALMQYLPDIEKMRAYGTKMGQLQESMLWLFEKTEQINRGITYKAATIKWNELWNKYVTKQGNPEKFYKKAQFGGIDTAPRETIIRLIKEGKLDLAKQRYGKELTANTQYLYTKGEAPLITRTQVGRQLWVFQTWWENYLEMFANWAKHKQYKNFVRWAITTHVAIQGGKLFGFDLSKWVGAAPLPQPFGGGMPVQPPLLEALKSAYQVGVSPLRAFTEPEEALESAKAGVKGLEKIAPVFVPGGTMAQQLYRIAKGKRQPIEIFAPIERARKMEVIRNKMLSTIKQYNKGFISAEERDSRLNKLRQEMKRRRKEVGK